ncbi:hypothetical protein NCLIV_029500 [Neospora caninum Liverpool]|uniref:Uncharacterized protein n=1 Tax=Neospora caninum (strain Liverpool) TaxID=572307 RepID=F0VHG8_NEOCL|nr:hypothetical protein NCLIV_029500 [Neospora caninum Liverpool]CBZ53162.1 hypothetical protein NCLIV_029500 [Neospora caninum Liverpool]CEL67152.1 TPA: hypothetical protein BN1204_029500 [Neospora caninum Liverpool]|eukprot:XP_003883194.1 hypothetical protein NCLIV_029500 [Neospora caninum Liverpool]
MEVSTSRISKFIASHREARLHACERAASWEFLLAKCVNCDTRVECASHQFSPTPSTTEALPRAKTKNRTTRQQVKSQTGRAENEVKGEIKEIKKINKDIKEIKKINQEIKKVNKEIKGEIKKINKEIKGEIKEIKKINQEIKVNKEIKGDIKEIKKAVKRISRRAKAGQEAV